MPTAVKQTLYQCFRLYCNGSESKQQQQQQQPSQDDNNGNGTEYKRKRKNRCLFILNVSEVRIFIIHSFRSFVVCFQCRCALVTISIFADGTSFRGFFPFRSHIDVVNIFNTYDFDASNYQSEREDHLI